MKTGTERPDNYAGYWPGEGWQVECLLHRDSEAIDLINALEIMERIARLKGPKTGIQSWEARHWAVGWVRHIALKIGGREWAIWMAAQREIKENYPILNDDNWIGDREEIDWDNEDAEEQLEVLDLHYSDIEARALTIARCFEVKP